MRSPAVSADERLVHEVAEAIDRAALDPTQWPGVVNAICASLPGTKAVVYVSDTHDHGTIDIVQSGFDAALMAEYQQYYAKLNPWVPYLCKSPRLVPLISDERFPASTFLETEFYQDWMARVGEAESTVGIKIVHEGERIGVLAVHFGTGMASRYNHRTAQLLRSNAARLRRAVEMVRLARRQEAGGAAVVQLGAFAVPAFLLDGDGRVLDLNDAARQLFDAGTLSLGFNNRLRISDRASSERIAAAARQIAAGSGPCSQGLDMLLTTADGRQRTLSLVAVREPQMAGMPAFFVPARLTLALVRPSAGSDTPEPSAPERQFGLTPAERRLAIEVASGISLRQSADRLGIAYHTARTQLKAVFSKTGVSRQAELVALLARLSSGGRPGRPT